MSAEKERGIQGSMPLSRAWRLYGLALGLMVILVFLGSHVRFLSAVLEPVAFFGYFACGFFLNRKVHRLLIDWHPVHKTIGNVSSSKLTFFAFWPVVYPFLFYRLAVIKYL